MTESPTPYVLDADTMTGGMRPIRQAVLALGSNLGDRLNRLQSAVAALEDTPEVTIVAISSVASQTTPAGLAAYASAKAALNAYIGVLAKDLKPRRIAVNALLPSTLGEGGIPYERVAESIAFLLSDAAASLTGQLIAMTL